MKSKKQISIERRAFSHLKEPLSVNFRFVSQWNNPKESKIIKGKAWNVSSTGLCLETGIAIKNGMLEFSETEATEKERVLPYLVSSEKEITLELNLSPNRDKILIMGKSIWHELAPERSMARLKIGVLFTHVSRETRDKWVQYIKDSNSLLSL